MRRSLLWRRAWGVCRPLAAQGSRLTLGLVLAVALARCGPPDPPPAATPPSASLDAGTPIDPVDAATVLEPPTTAPACAPPSLLWLEANPPRLGPDGGTVLLNFGARDATSLRVVLVQDERELCRWPGSCALLGDLRSGSVQVEPPYQLSSFLVELKGPGGRTSGVVDVELEPPRFPDRPYNDISMWLLARRPVRAPWSFVVLADSQPASGGCPAIEQTAFAELRQQILQLEPRPDLVLALGDVVALGARCEWDPYVREALSPFVDTLGIPWITVIGNHEQYDGQGVANFEYFAGATDFSFDVARARFVALNAFHRNHAPTELYLSTAQLEFFTQQLQRASGDSTRDLFLLMHHPPSAPLSQGLCQYYLFAPFAGAFFDRYNGYTKAEAVVTLLERYAPPATMGFYGHVHVFGHYERNRVHHVVAGGGGGPLCQAGELDLREEPSAEPPYRDGIFHHFLHVLVRSERGQDVEVRVHKHGESQPMQGYSFSLP